MKRSNIYIASALSAALALGAVVGCGNQAQDQQKEATEQATEQTQELSQEELLAEFKDAAVKAPAFTSVTVHEQSMSAYTGEKIEDSGPDTISTTADYKFDESGSKPKTSAECEVDSVKLKYVSDGEKVVFVSDEGNYEGTVEQFELTFTQGLEAYLKEIMGVPKDLVACASNIAKEQQGDNTVWTLTLDPEKYMQSDEILQTIAKSDDPITEETVTVTFDKDGNIIEMSEKSVFAKDHSSESKLSFSDFDKTTVEALPKADKTYEDYEKDEEAKLDELTDSVEVEDAEDAKK